ncbi:MAG: dTDP-4-dehydrorhamnose 3,5-epimerase [Planctomycetota bacterium]|nr:dTDP-4-dehydrorhamnose 3,5-epimerase [Planctomycetota bacterium]
MNVIETKLSGVLILETKIYRDDRGHFLEAWHESRYEEAGLPRRFVQDNMSYSTKGVLRGLHFQTPAAQAKLVSVLCGSVYDVAVDVRVGSPTFGQWVGMHLSAENGRQAYIPEGFAHGFAVTGEEALVLYKCTEFYSPKDEVGLLWNDPAIGIEWPIADPILSRKDADSLPLSAIIRDRLPRLAPAPAA